MRLYVKPLTLKQANALVEELHRHHGRKQTHRFSIGVFDDLGACHGAAIVDRPARPQTDQYLIAEVSRLATDGTPNACSMLYAACANAAKAMGYRHIQTFILASEPGTSLRAAGWTLDHEVIPHGDNSWSHKSRTRTRNPKTDNVPKTMWIKVLNSRQPL